VTIIRKTCKRAPEIAPDGSRPTLQNLRVDRDGYGFAHHVPVGRAFGRVGNRPNLCFLANPGPPWSYPEPLLSLTKYNYIVECRLVPGRLWDQLDGIVMGGVRCRWYW